MASRFIIILVTALLVCSCGKSDKPEYVDDKEVKQETQNRDSLPPGEVKNIDSNNVKQDEGKQQTEKDKFSYQRSETPVAVISPLEASDYMGKYVTVKGIVVDIYKSDKVAYLNFVEKYPNNPFTGVIFANKFEEFGDITKYEGTHVEVSGRVSTFRGKPQMILDKLSQIKIVN